VKVSIAEFIDNLGVSKFTWLIFLLCGVTILFDGYDFMVVSYTMPQISGDWALTKVQTGSLVSWSLVGTMLGGFLSGLISDAIGRKKTIIISCVLYSLFCGLIFFARNFETFAICRVISGFGLGAALPVALTVVSEFVPSKNRAFFVSGILGFYTAGWIVAGAVAMNVIPVLGWRFCYFIGFLPILYAIVLAIYLPESARWLLSKGRESEGIKILQKIEKAAKGVASEWAPGSVEVPPAPKVVGCSALFSREYLKVTLRLWFLYFFGMVIIYGFTGWLPSLLVAKGYSIMKSYTYSIMTTSAMVVANFVVGYISDTIGRRKSIGIGFAIFGIMIILLGYSSTQSQLILFAILAGFFSNFATTAIQPLFTESYPTEFRNTGVAWAQGFGRFGGIVGPIAAGFALQAGFGFAGTLCMFAAPALFNVLIAMFYRLETKGKTLENITKEISASSS